MRQLRLLGDIATHHLVPVRLEDLARRKRLAHQGIRVLEVDVILVDAEDDDVVAAVPLLLDGLAAHALCAQPHLGKGDHRMPRRREFLDLVEGKSFPHLGLEAERRGAANEVLGEGTDLRGRAGEPCDFILGDVLPPIAEHRLQGRRTAGVLRALAGS